MSDNTRRKGSSKRRLVVAVLLGVLVGGSAFFAVMLNQHPVQPDSRSSSVSDDKVDSVYTSPYDSNGQLNVTRLIEMELRGVPNQCYIVYENSTDESNYDTLLYFYKPTLDAVRNTPLVNGSDVIFNKFMHLPYVEIYFYNHCNFLDTKKYPLPSKYDPSQGINESHEAREKRIVEIKNNLLMYYNFYDYAKNATSIVSLGSRYLMTPQEVIDHMFTLHLITLNDNCKKGGFDSNSTVYNCVWHGNYFEYETTTGMVFLLGQPPRDNAPVEKTP